MGIRSAVVSVLLVTASLAGGCADPPPVCAEATLAKAAQVEATSERLYASPAVNAALEASAAARAELATQQRRLAVRRSYDKAAVLCQQADATAITAALAVDAARQRRIESDAIAAATSAATARTSATLAAGRALLDAVPQPALDARLRGILAAHRQGEAIAAAARSALAATGFMGDTAPIAAARSAAEQTDADANAAVLAIRRGATAKCQPRDKRAALVFGPRARAHDGFALVQAGPSEDDPQGFITVVARDERDACRTLYAKRVDEVLALPLDAGVTLSTWRVPGVIPVRLLFAWSGRYAWFIGDAGRWAFDAGKVGGFANVCASVSCSDPVVSGVHIDVSCTCVDPTSPDILDLARSVRFSWHGNAVLAER